MVQSGCETTKKQTKATTPINNEEAVEQKKSDDKTVATDPEKTGKKQEEKGALNYENFKYEGEVKNGKPHGKGVLYIYDDKNHKTLLSKVEGEFKNGKPSGEMRVSNYDKKGKLISKYTGTLKGLSYDRGTLTTYDEKGNVTSVYKGIL